MSSFATRIFAFTESGLVDWQGSYDDFVERFGGDGQPPSEGGSSRSRSTPSDSWAMAD